MDGGPFSETRGYQIKNRFRNKVLIFSFVFLLFIFLSLKCLSDIQVGFGEAVKYAGLELRRGATGARETDSRVFGTQIVGN